mmetsp:Transcript_3248/g.4585  ORF Transcript_3248/g.4585 Transcript_3248/m.4585 type:complete len:296 (+) Transcript_3248:191-1078(+)
MISVSNFLSDFRSILKLGFVVCMLWMHKFGTSMAFLSHVKCTDFQKTCHADPVRNGMKTSTSVKRELRKLTMKEVAVYAEGQDSSEMFEVYLPPPPECDSTCCVPVRAGFQKPRGEVHRDGDWHRSVHIWISDDKGNLMLQRRSEFKDTFPNCWDVSAGGHVTGSDGILETAIREVEEEIGLEIPHEALVHLCCVPSRLKGSTIKHGDFECNEFQDMYLVVVEGLKAEDIKYAEGEVAEIKLIPYLQAKAKYDAEDPHYVPRPKLYFKSLFDKMDSLFASSVQLRSKRSNLNIRP